MSPDALSNASRQVQSKRAADLKRAKAKRPVDIPPKTQTGFERADSNSTQEDKGPQDIEPVSPGPPITRRRSLLTEALREPESPVSAASMPRPSRAELRAMAEECRRQSAELQAKAEAKLREAEALLAAGDCSIPESR